MPQTPALVPLQFDPLTASARRLLAVVPNDAADLPEIPKALWIMAPGTLKIVGADDASNAGTSMGDLPAGTVVPVRARRVLATGTTATVVALL